MTYDNKDIYEISVQWVDDVLPVCLFALHVNFAFHSNKDEIAFKSKVVNYSYTVRKDLKSKCDSNFTDKLQ